MPVGTVLLISRALEVSVSPRLSCADVFSRLVLSRLANVISLQRSLTTRLLIVFATWCLGAVR